MATDLNRSDSPCTPVVIAPDAFARASAYYIAEAIAREAARREIVSVALSGGRSPAPVYQALAKMLGVPWDQVMIYFADERAVAPEHHASNYRMVKESLLDALPASVAGVQRMQGERSDLAQAAAEYEALLPARLDILVLGIGEDGHTASLFPRHPAVMEERRRVLGVQTSADPRWRITITPPVIHAAVNCLVLVAGASKAAAVARACQGPLQPIECPAQLARGGVWLVDEPAASRLRLPSPT